MTVFGWNINPLFKDQKFYQVRYCEISAKRKDSDHHDIIDLTAFNTDGFDVTGQKTLGKSALFAGCPILLTSEYYFAGFDILMYSFTLFPKHLADYQTIWLAAFCRETQRKRRQSRWKLQTRTMLQQNINISLQGTISPQNDTLDVTELLWMG